LSGVKKPGSAGNRRTDMKEWIEKVNKEYDEKIEIVKRTCVMHHASYFKGYVSRRTKGFIEPYIGKYGRGYKIYLPNWSSTWFSVVQYWIEK
jgi:hypothetical protein